MVGVIDNTVNSIKVVIIKTAVTGVTLGSIKLILLLLGLDSVNRCKWAKHIN